MTTVAAGPDVAGAGAPVDAADEPVLAIDEIQGHVVPGFPQTFQRFVGLRLPEGDAAAPVARSMLSALAPEVTSARAGLTYRSARRAARHGPEPTTVPAGTAVAVALSARCLRALGHPELATIDQAFQAGMAARRYLRDPAPRNWPVGPPGAEIDILVILADDDEAHLADAEKRILERAHGLTVVHHQTAHRLAGEIEHFGFRDGISQPTLRGRVDPGTPLAARRPMPAMPDGRAYARAGDVLVWPGQFLFGLPRQSPTSATAPAAARAVPDLARNGSLLVYRKLAQDVAAFHTDTATMAATLSAGSDRPVSPEAVRAWLVGRQPDGTALARADAPGTGTPAELNHFGYDNDVPAVPGPDGTVRGATADADGLRCPLSAHIRKVNPRDQETDQGGQQVTLTTMILRRGIPYGPAYDHGDADAPDNAAERGLLFLCYQTDLARQFELLVQRWAHPVDRPRQGLPNGADLIIGRTRAPGEIREARVPDATVSTALDYVTPLGGAYLFTPSIPALEVLSRPPA